MSNISEGKLKKLRETDSIREFGEILQDKNLNGERNLTEDTILNYMKEVELFYREAGIPYDEKPTKKQATDWKREAQKRLSKKALVVKIVALNHYLKYYCEYNWQLPQIKNITRKKEPHPLTEQQINSMMQYAEQKGKYTSAMVIFIGFKTASRIGTLINLKINDINFDVNTIILRKAKGDNDLRVPLSKEDMDKIREYIDKHRPKNLDNDYLFISANTKREITPSFVYHSLKRWAHLCGIKTNVYPHILRHSRIKDLRTKGYSWEEIMVITGHKSIMSLSSYIHEEDFDKVQAKLNTESDIQSQHQIQSQPQPDLITEILRKENEALKLKLEMMQLQIQINQSTDKPRMDNNKGYV